MPLKRSNIIIRLVIIPAALAVLILSFTALNAEESGIPGGDEFLEGRRLQKTGEWAASIEAFRSAASVYSLVADYALYQIAQSASKIGDKELAASSLAELIRSYPATPVKRDAQIELAGIYEDMGKPGLAVPLIQAALPGAKSSRETVELTLMLTRAYAQLKDSAKRDSLCWQLIHGWPSTPEALEAAKLVGTLDTLQRRLAVAKVYFQNRKPKEALAILDELTNDPQAASLLAEILLYKAQSLAMDGQKQEAANLYDKIISEYVDYRGAPAAFFNKAECLRSLGSSEQALADYARVVELFPSNGLAPQALRQRARILESMGDPREYAEYEKILIKYPRSAYAYSETMRWGVKLFRDKDYKDSRDVFERLLNANLNSDANADAAFWAAKCLLAEGKLESAKVALAGVIATFEDSYQAFRSRAILKNLGEASGTYAQPHTEETEKLLAFDKEPFVSFEADTAEKAYTSIEDNLRHVDEQTMRRLQFLMVNRLPESRWELERIFPQVGNADSRYAMAWAFFHAQAYNRSIRIASSLRGTFSQDPRATRIQYLLYPTAYPELVITTAMKYDVDPMLSLAVMREESHFLEDSVSTSDACGLMQILPSTGQWLAGRMFGPVDFQRSDLFLPSVNIELGNYYLRYLLNKFDNNIMLSIAAYNWGETNLRRWMNQSPPEDFDAFVESIPADETRRYVKKVLRSYAIYRSLYPIGLLANGGS